MNKQLNVILDACVLYPAPVRDILLNIAALELFFPKWSAMIQDEWIRNLLKNRPDLSEKRLRRTVKAMDFAFPNALVIDYQVIIPNLDLPDINDRHVLAAALKSDATKIVTFNLKDFPNKNLGQYKVQAVHPDDFIINLFESNPNEIKQAFQNQLNSLKNPPMTKEQLLGIFIKCGLNKTAELLKD